MHEIDVSRGIQVGGFHWPVKADGRECLKNSHFGECTSNEHYLTIDVHWSPERVSETIIHEMLEAVKHIYLDGALKHRDLTLIANGLHQVLESLGVRFVVRYQEDKVLEGVTREKANADNGHRQVAR